MAEVSSFMDYLPCFPWEGPPLPRYLGIRWGSFLGSLGSSSGSSGSGSSGSSLSIGAGLGTPQLPSPLLGTSQPSTTYDNIEEVELSDIDPDLLMPRKIIIHRKARSGNGIGNTIGNTIGSTDGTEQSVQSTSEENMDS